MFVIVMAILTDRFVNVFVLPWSGQHSWRKSLLQPIKRFVSFAYYHSTKLTVYMLWSFVSTWMWYSQRSSSQILIDLLELRMYVIVVQEH